jgi:hypothetical protein
VFAGIGLLFALGSLGLDLGTPLALGSGAFPLATGVIVAGLGIAITIAGVVRPSQETGDDGVERPARFGSIPWRPLVIVLSVVVFFALTLEGLGLVPTAFVSIAAVSFARPETTWKQALLASAVLTALAWVVFVVLLTLRVPTFGPWIGG